MIDLNPIWAYAVRFCIVTFGLLFSIPITTFLLKLVTRSRRY